MIDWLRRCASKSIIVERLIYACYLLYGGIVSFLFVVMRLFPIKRTKIVFCSTKGKQYGDNSKYVYDELIKLSNNYDIVWLLNDNLNAKLPEGTRRVRYGSIKSVYELATAKVWVDSNNKRFGTLKRNGQIYIQNWHGSYGIKKSFYDIPEKSSSIERLVVKHNSKIEDYMISNSVKENEIYRRAFLFKNKIITVGSSRNDLFFYDNSKIKKRIEKFFDVEGRKILLYAPTFRNNFNLDVYDIDFEKTLNALGKRFGGDWVCLMRLHPSFDVADSQNFSFNSVVKNATNYSNMQELLAAADVLITDYSSCMLDFATCGNICFLYATDVDKYRNEREYYQDVTELPFPLAQSNSELETGILKFDEVKYKEELKKLHSLVGLNETGKASYTVAKLIVEIVEGKEE